MENKRYMDGGVYKIKTGNYILFLWNLFFGYTLPPYFYL